MLDKRQIGLLVALVVIGGAIYWLDSQKVETNSNASSEELVVEGDASESAIADKKMMYDKAKEIVDASGYVNVDGLKLKDLIGKQVILVDFWTYSCINCQRTQPYLNAWQEKYGDKGLTIVGVHTPEFEFEKDLGNVQEAVQKAGIKYPVVLDNDYATWRAYGNRYWPRKYLIDIDGYIVYDHIGEGGYDETEHKIQELLVERADRLGEKADADASTVQVSADTPSANLQSPETYFGSLRNKYLTNGQAGVEGRQDLMLEKSAALNELQLGGSWDFQPEFAQNTAGGALIRFRYKAKQVYMVASAEQPVTVTIKRDGKLVGSLGGEDVNDASQAVINEERLYKLVSENAVGEHTLEIEIPEGDLKAFTLTFG